MNLDLIKLKIIRIGMRIFADTDKEKETDIDINVDFVKLLVGQIVRLLKKGLKRSEITRLLEEAKFSPREIADAWAKYEREYAKFVKTPASLRLIARKIFKIRRQILNEFYQ